MDELHIDIMRIVERHGFTWNSEMNKVLRFFLRSIKEISKTQDKRRT